MYGAGLLHRADPGRRRWPPRSSTAWAASLVIHGTLSLGTLVALAALLSRLYGPLTALSNVQVDVMTALVSFERVFEVLDLKPLIADAARTPRPLPGAAPPPVEFDDVRFRYPQAAEVSLASLESIALPVAEHAGPTPRCCATSSFRAPAGQLVALVGPSGAGKTTITAPGLPAVRPDAPARSGSAATTCAT